MSCSSTRSWLLTSRRRDRIGSGVGLVNTGIYSVILRIQRKHFAAIWGQFVLLDMRLCVAWLLQDTKAFNAIETST